MRAAEPGHITPFMRVYHVIKNGNILILNIVVKRAWNRDSTSTETGIGRLSYLSGCLFFGSTFFGAAMPCGRTHTTVRPVFKDLR